MKVSLSEIWLDQDLGRQSSPSSNRTHT